MKRIMEGDKIDAEREAELTQQAALDFLIRSIPLERRLVLNFQITKSLEFQWTEKHEDFRCQVKKISFSKRIWQFSREF